MNIKVFFISIFAVLGIIFVAFKPLHVKQSLKKDVPLFELKDFVLYELDTQRLKTITYGIVGIRYSDRYKIKNLNYNDNGKNFVVNIVANDAIYKDNILNLDGDVVYTRSDGLVFETQKALYNQKTKVVISKTPYVAHKNNNVVVGRFIKYNSITKKVYSTNVDAKYDLEEK